MTPKAKLLYEHEPAAAIERLAYRYRHTRTFRLWRDTACRHNWRISTVNSPSDWSAGHTTHMSSAFQSSTVQADRKAKLYAYGGP
jgi:hypothetical protein